MKFQQRLILPCLLFAVNGAMAASHDPSAALRYKVSLSDKTQHKLHVYLEIPAGAADHDLQLPVWNATYQVRDFSKNVNWITAQGQDGAALPVTLLDKSRWRVSGTGSGAEVEYEIIADEPGPYGAQLSTQHAFFNLAEILMFPLDCRDCPIEIDYSDVPPTWRAATALPGSLSDGFKAQNYDRLVDAPIEFGSFRETDFDQDGARYRVVVDANSNDYDLSKITALVKRVAAAETKWMDDRPFDSYLFIYHFARGAGGGMEHAFSTAITLDSESMASHPGLLADVTAHEFFHLWNVKRIRPRSLEPVDYTRENYSPSLWFSEGVTSTVGLYTLLQTGDIDESRFRGQLADVIEQLQASPAHTRQSAEASSMDAWLEKYAEYRKPERSISYYDKGEMLGVLLDLQLREDTHGTKSLQDLFRLLNVNYAKRGKLFADSEELQQAVKAVSPATDSKEFFEKYVAGLDEIPWNAFFKTVGCRVDRQTVQIADVGFTVTRNFDETPVVASVAAASEAARAGLQVGDAITEMDGHVPGHDFQGEVTRLDPGSVVHFRVRSSRGQRNLRWKLAGRATERYELSVLQDATEQQKSRRSAWLKGVDEVSGAVAQ